MAYGVRDYTQVDRTKAQLIPIAQADLANRRSQIMSERLRRKNMEMAGIADEFRSVVEDPQADERAINIVRARTQSRILKSPFMDENEKLRSSNVIDALSMGRISQGKQSAIPKRETYYNPRLDKGKPVTQQFGSMVRPVEDEYYRDTNQPSGAWRYGDGGTIPSEYASASIDERKRVQKYREDYNAAAARVKALQDKYGGNSNLDSLANLYASGATKDLDGRPLPALNDLQAQIVKMYIEAKAELDASDRNLRGLGRATDSSEGTLKRARTQVGEPEKDRVHRRTKDVGEGLGAFSSPKPTQEGKRFKILKVE